MMSTRSRREGSGAQPVGQGLACSASSWCEAKGGCGVTISAIDVLSKAWSETRDDPFSCDEVVEMISVGLASCVTCEPHDRKNILSCLDDSEDADWSSIYSVSYDELFCINANDPTAWGFIVGIAAVCFLCSANRRGIGSWRTSDYLLLKFLRHHLQIGGTASKASLLRKVCAERVDDVS